MANWTAYVQVNGIEISYFRTIEFDIPEELFQKATGIVESGALLSESDIYHALYSHAYSAIDMRDYIDTSWFPEREDYDTEEEFIEEYNKEMERALEDLFLEHVDIYDPNEFEHFKQQFIGKCFPDMETGESYVETFEVDEQSDRVVRYSLDIQFNEDGTITDLTDLYALGMEWEGVRRSSYEECYPDYELLTEELEDQLGECE